MTSREGCARAMFERLEKIFRLVDVKEFNFDSTIITFTTIKMFFSQLESFLGLHDLLNDPFGHGFTLR